MKRRLAYVLVAASAFLCRPVHADPPNGATETASSEPPASEVDRCVADHERAAALRSGPHWLDARAAMTACSADGCPLAIRSDCSAWLDDLAKMMPSVLVIVERDEPSGSVELQIDGQPVALADPPAPLELLPGTHRLRFALGSHAPIEREVSLAPGEKNKVIRVSFASPRAPRAPAPPRTVRTIQIAERPIPTSTMVLSGSALVAALGSGALLVSALVSRREARTTCAPECGSDVTSPIRLKLIFSDVTGIVALGLTSAAIYTYVRRPTVEHTALMIGPTLSGDGAAGLSVEGAF